MNTLNTKTTFAKNVAYPGLLVLIILSLVAAFFPDTVNTALTNIQDSVYRHMSWVYILLVSFFVISLLVLTFSKMGNIRLGADNSEPQYSFFSWISMLFAAGMGIGLMYFGVAEPMSHYVYPALPEIANHAKDAQLATFFHWGIHAWAIFAVMGLVLAYFSFRYKLPLSIRSGLYPILGDRIHGWIGDVVDIFALVSTFFGISTSMGFGVMQLNAGLAAPFRLPFSVRHHHRCQRAGDKLCRCRSEQRGETAQRDKYRCGDSDAAFRAVSWSHHVSPERFP